MKNKVYSLLLALFIMLIFSGCKSGSGGGSSSIFGGSDSGLAGGSGNVNGGSGDLGAGSGDGEPIALVHNPEPSSLLLLTSGLISMAVYARKKQKNKSKK